MRIACCWLFAVIGLCVGCVSRPFPVPIPKGDVPVIELGWSMEQVEAALRDSSGGRYELLKKTRKLERAERIRLENRSTFSHEFTISQGDQIITCVSASVFHLLTGYYFLFEDQRLIRVVDERQASSNVKKKGWSWWWGASASTRFEAILAAEGIPLERWSTLTRERAEEAVARDREWGEVFPGLFIGWSIVQIGNLITWPIREPIEKRIEADRTEKYIQLDRRFDGLRVEMGSTRETVEELFGPPLGEFPADEEGQAVAVYGPTAEEGAEANAELSWKLIAVQYRDGRVTRVTSNQSGLIDERIVEDERIEKVLEASRRLRD